MIRSCLFFIFCILLADCLAFQASFGTFGRALRSRNNNANGLTMQIQVKAPKFERSGSIGITLSRYMVELVAANPELSGLESLVSSLQIGCKTIANVIERAPLTGLTGLEGGGGSVNVQGEEQKKLDVITNEIMKDALRFSGKVGVLASEEEDKPVSVDGSISDKYANPGATGLTTTQFNSDVIIEETGGKYIAVFDPLDGSSNVDAGIPTGTIFGIFEEDPNAVCEVNYDNEVDFSECLVNTLRPGTSLVAAGYCLYSSSVFFCLTVGAGVNIFTLDRQIGEFVLSHPDVRIPQRGKIYSFNEANKLDWDLPLQQYVQNIQNGRGESGQKYISRYIGSMVGDIHRTLLYGGIFGYPATPKNPNGKLRLLYEAAPMSFLMEQAGGLSVTGNSRIMEFIPQSVHQRVPCIMGSPDDINEAKRYYERSTDETTLKNIAARAAW